MSFSRLFDDPRHREISGALRTSFPRVVVMDGGTGTTLEDVFAQELSTTPLWSARVVHDNPTILEQTHSAFLRAGSRVISSATYQATFETFEKAGFTRDAAEDLMLQAVAIADNARKLHEAGDVKLALSLGPYGAALQPSQEFDGLYPPPFGPASSDATVRTTSFASDAQEENALRTRERETLAQQNLTQWHLQRLMVFARAKEVWERIDLIAFETVPLLREAAAIRRAMYLLSDTMSSNLEWKLKPWYISFDFPNGKHAQERWSGGPPISPHTLLTETFTPAPEDMLVPSGLGINCTEPQFLEQLVEEWTSTLASTDNTCLDDTNSSRNESYPWLVVYPNGGLVYDVEKRAWVQTPDHSRGVVADQWARTTVTAIERGCGSRADVWGGLLIGGCCKTDPVYIRSLVKSLNVE